MPCRPSQTADTKNKDIILVLGTSLLFSCSETVTGATLNVSVSPASVSPESVKYLRVGQRKMIVRFRFCKLYTDVGNKDPSSHPSASRLLPNPRRRSTMGI